MAALEHYHGDCPDQAVVVCSRPVDDGPIPNQSRTEGPTASSIKARLSILNPIRCSIRRACHDPVI